MTCSSGFIRRYFTMTFQWIGQNGFIFNAAGKTILVDPYLSDSCKTHRYTPIKKEIFDVVPDIIICTHDHLDHTDKDSLLPFLQREKKIEFISPYSSYLHVLSWGYRQHNYILFEPGTVWTSGGVRITGVKAYHSDREAIGVIIEAEGKKVYITGDTLYNTNLAPTLPKDLDAVFVCTNGAGNNMNMADAMQLCRELCPKAAYPVHIGMFDQKDPHEFDLPFAKYPMVYSTAEIE